MSNIVEQAGGASTTGRVRFLFLCPKGLFLCVLVFLGLLFVAFFLFFIVEQAGGASSTGRERIMAMPPKGLHQRVPVILGSKNEVEKAVQYHNEMK